MDRFKDYANGLDTKGLLQLRQYIQEQNQTAQGLLEAMVYEEKILYVEDKLYSQELELNFGLDDLCSNCLLQPTEDCEICNGTNSNNAI